MIEFFSALDPEIKGALILIALYIADVIATRTPNPIDNLIVRFLKKQYAKKYR